jgi:hypothetical protein
METETITRKTAMIIIAIAAVVCIAAFLFGRNTERRKHIANAEVKKSPLVQ